MEKSVALPLLMVEGYVGRFGAGVGAGPIHRSAWKRSSANFALRGFSEVSQDEESGGTMHKKRAGTSVPALGASLEALL